MKRFRWYGIVLNLILAALVITGAALYAINSNGKQSGRTLVIRDSGTGRVYGKWPLGKSGEFAIEFVHSVHQGPVRELYKAEGMMIRPYSVRFTSFGAGMQSDLEEGRTLSRDGDALVMSGFTASFKELNYIVGTVSDHLLIVNEDIFSLREICGRNAHITIRVK